MSMREHSLEDLVRRTAHVRDEDLQALSETPVARALLDDVMSSPLETSEIPPSPEHQGPARGRRPRRVAFLVAAVLIAGGAAAVAVRTAQEPIDEFGRGPELMPAEQLAQLDRLARDIPLPPRGTFDELRESIRRFPAAVSREGFVDMLAYNAACQWYEFWLAGYDSGDERQMAAALETIEEIPHWPHMGKAVAERILARAAAAGSPEPIRLHLRINC